MLLQHLFETSEEDRAIISLSSAIYAKISQYSNNDPTFVNLGKIGDMFDTPLHSLDDISITLEGGDEFIQHAQDPNDPQDYTDKELRAYWDEDTKTIAINKDYIGTHRMKTTITHELRHALDNEKSNSYPGNGAQRYFTPKKKEHRKNDPYSTAQYRARPAEINARFVELLDVLSKRIPQWYNKLPPEQIKKQLSTDFKNLLNKYEIADLFPEKTQSSDYKRLYKRAYDFMQKEMNHTESELAKQGVNKHATGEW